MNATAPAPAAPKKKSGSGCVIALAIVGGLGLLAVVGIGVGVYAFSQSKEGKAIFGTIGDMTEIMSEAQNAPGTKEVRALGCDQAMALDFEKMERVISQRFDAGGSKGASAFSMMVIWWASSTRARRRATPSRGRISRPRRSPRAASR